MEDEQSWEKHSFSDFLGNMKRGAEIIVLVVFFREDRKRKMDICIKGNHFYVETVKDQNIY